MAVSASEVIPVEGMEWDDEFLPWFDSVWEPGQHVGMIAHTGAGKTTFGYGLCQQRRYVLIPDAKGGDSTLDGFGYVRLPRWPGKNRLQRMVEDNDEHGRPSRYVIGTAARTKREVLDLERSIEATLDEAYEMGGWTVYLDEAQIITDPRMMGFRKNVDQLMIAARDRGISVVSSAQAARWVTPATRDQAMWLCMSRTRDVDTVNRLAEILGHDKATIRGLIKALQKFSWVIVGRDPFEPLRVTIPSYVAPKRKDDVG